MSHQCHPPFSHSEPLKVSWVLTLLCLLHNTPHTASRVNFLTEEMHSIPLLQNSLCSFRIEYKPQITYKALHTPGFSHTPHSAILQILSVLLPCLLLPGKVFRTVFCLCSCFSKASLNFGGVNNCILQHPYLGFQSPCNSLAPLLLKIFDSIYCICNQYFYKDYSFP